MLCAHILLLSCLTGGVSVSVVVFFFFQAEDGIRDLVRSRGLGDVYKRQEPGRLALEGAAERLDLAHLAAGLAQRDAFVEGIDAVPGGVLLHGLGLRKIDAQGLVVLVGDLLHQAVGLLVQAAGVEGEHLDAGDVARDQVGQHHVLGAEAVGEGGWGEFAFDALEQRDGCLLYTSPSPRDRTRSRMPSSA